jgi:glycosyltransferase involved in cell wall biosynthesis
MSLPELSVVVPAFNEAGNIEKLVREAATKLAALASFEIIVIDDGSSDETGAQLDRLARELPALRVIHHAERSGKSAALRTGMMAARSVWVATMDGDGQNDPADIVNMTKSVDLSRIDRVGLVAGTRKKRNDGASRKFASRFANGLRRALLNDDCPDTACGLKLIPRDLFLALPFFDALHRYLPAFVRHMGYDAIYVMVDDRPRQAGVSKYSNIGRAAAGLVDLMGVIWLMRRSHLPPGKALITVEGNT